MLALDARRRRLLDAWDGAGRGADADEPFLCNVALLQLVVQLLELRLQLGVVRHGIQNAGAGAGGQPVAARDIGDKPRRGDARGQGQRVQAQAQVLSEDWRGALGAASIDRRAAVLEGLVLFRGTADSPTAHIDGKPQFRNTPVRHLNVILSA